MKRLTIFAAVIAAAAVVVLPAGALSPVGGIKNASFEGFFAQWTVTVPPGAAAFIVGGQLRPGGGSRYANIWTDGPGGGASLDQTFPGAAGTKITGFARFQDGEGGPGSCVFTDFALIEIDGNAVFEADSCTTGDTGPVVWTYVLTSTGNHTIHGEVQNGTDDILDSALYMDAPVVTKLTP